MIGVLDLFESLVYACLYTFVLLLWTGFILCILCPIIIMVIWLLLVLLLGAALILIKVTIYFIPDSRDALEPCSIVILDFGDFIFPASPFFNHMRQTRAEPPSFDHHLYP